MRVALLIDTWFPFIGGGQINAWEISKRIANGDVFIDIITRNNGQDNLKLPKNLKVYKLGPKAAAGDTSSRITYLVRSFFFIYKRDYDLIHAHAFLPGTVARLLMVTKGIPAILTVHGTSIGTNLNNFFIRWLEKFILTQIRYTAQITVSQDFLKINNINKQSFSSNKKVIYIPNGVDVSKFDKIKSDKFENPTLIFVGRLHPQKNLKILLKAVELVRKDIPNIRLLIVGEGPQKEEITKYVRNLHLQKTVKLLGRVTGSDLIRLYKSSHLFILTSIYEGQPLTLLEAWAAKLPVVVTKTGDCQYLVKNGYNGFLIKDTNDFREITEIVKKAIKNKQSFSANKNLNRIDQNGYNLVKKNFSWEKSANETLRLYESLTTPKN